MNTPPLPDITETNPGPDGHSSTQSRQLAFDAEWYLQAYPDVAESGMDPQFHFIHHGAAEGRLPNPKFDPHWYLHSYPDVEHSGMPAGLHYVLHGAAEGRSIEPDFSSPITDNLGYWQRCLEASEWFDDQWYLIQYPDVAAAGMEAAYHYLLHGCKEGKRPGPLFDEDYYQNQVNAPLDLPSAFLHFLAFGQRAGLQPVRQWSEQPWWWQLPRHQSQPLHEHVLQQLADHPLPVVVIPVFNASDALRKCLHSLAQYRQGIQKVIVINDCSTEPDIGQLLAQYAQESWFEAHVNTRNSGFSASVNRGITLAGEADVILLNSDTQVTAGFAQRLRATAYSDTNIATVTPLSNNAGAFSVPQAGYNAMPAIGLARFARAIAQAGAPNPIETPTGHGFCMYIRHAALKECGLFDATAFPRGYGEENDFCMRAIELGWRHLIDCRTYIYHQGSASFGAAKQALLAQGKAVIDQRYPHYDRLVAEVFGGPAITQLRADTTSLIAATLHKAAQIKPRVLFVLSTRTGGTPKTNQDLMQSLAEDIECFVLHCDSKQLTFQHFLDGVYTDLATHTLTDPIEAFPHTSDEYNRLVAQWLLHWSIDLIHIRHLAWHGLGLISTAKLLGIGVVKSFHDFYALCPSLKLLDNNEHFCAARCTPGAGTCKIELWPEQHLLDLKHHKVIDWRNAFSQCLKQCDAFITTNQLTKDIFLEHYPELGSKPFQIIPHGRDFAQMENLATAPQEGERLRLISPGNMVVAKGLGLLEQLAHQRPDVEIHILGRIPKNTRLPENIIVHGNYPRDQFHNRVAEIKPHCGAVLSIWPETWCHTLTELWAAGIPVIGTNLGAVGERINTHKGGWLIEKPCIEELLKLLPLVESPTEWQEKQQAVIQWQNTNGKEENCHSMAQAYRDIYHQLLALG
jgi:GT2 family glycosyltransferase/glycosyltransferase involved in cell wall biosynthesis